MNELIAAAKTVIERWDTPLWKDVPATGEYIARLRAAVERAEKQERVGFGEWFEYQDKYLTAEETWTAAKEDERERIRAIVKEMMVDDTWVFGDSLLERIDE